MTQEEVAFKHKIVFMHDNSRIYDTTGVNRFACRPFHTLPLSFEQE